MTLAGEPGQRPSTGIFIYAKPKDQVQKNHNKEALALLETKKSQLIIVSDLTLDHLQPYSEGLNPCFNG